MIMILITNVIGEMTLDAIVIRSETAVNLTNKYVSKIPVHTRILNVNGTMIKAFVNAFHLNNVVKLFKVICVMEVALKI